MSGILTREGEQTAESTNETDRPPLNQVLRVVMEQADSGGSTGAQNRKLARTFVVMDVGAALRYLRGTRGGTTEIAETAAEFASGPEPERDQKRRGRGMLTRLFLVGVVVGLGYVLRTRSESVDEMVDRVTERTQSVANRAAEQTATVTETAADRIQESSEQAAERLEETGEQTAEQVQEGGERAAGQIKEGGEQAADQIDEAAETATEVGEEAAETVGEGSDESEDTEANEE